MIVSVFVVEAAGPGPAIHGACHCGLPAVYAGGGGAGRAANHHEGVSVVTIITVSSHRATKRPTYTLRPYLRVATAAGRACIAQKSPTPLPSRPHEGHRRCQTTLGRSFMPICQHERLFRLFCSPLSFRKVTAQHPIVFDELPLPTLDKSGFFGWHDGGSL